VTVPACGSYSIKGVLHWIGYFVFVSVFWCLSWWLCTAAFQATSFASDTLRSDLTVAAAGVGRVLSLGAVLAWIPLLVPAIIVVIGLIREKQGKPVAVLPLLVVSCLFIIMLVMLCLAIMLTPFAPMSC